MGIKLTYEFVKSQIEKEGYKLLSKEYIHNRSKLNVRCNKGHEYKTRWNDFQQEHRCPYCAGLAKHTYEYVKKQIERVEGYKLLSKNYKNTDTKLEVQCNKGHKYSVSFWKFQQSQRCPKCCKYISGLTYKYVKEQIESVKGYKLLSKNYVNNLIKLKIKCSEGHIYKVNYGNWYGGTRCPICDRNKKSSKGEKEVFEFITSITNENVIANDRTQIINPLTNYNLELDIWIPSLNKAIEFNGKYWHSFEEIKIRDNEKIKQCKEKGIELLVIKEQNWLDNRNNEINKIMNWINYEN